MMSRHAALLFLAVVILFPHAAAAQDAGSTPSREAEAGEHFARGLGLFNEGRLDAALAEFQRAYDVAPAYPVLYNIGRVYAELGRPVEAARAFERYLAEGGTSIAAARRDEAAALLTRQLERIGRVFVETNVPGSIVTIDGVDVAATPLERAVDVGAGHHTLGVRAPGHESVTFALDLAGGVEDRRVVLLRPEVVPRGALRITASLPDVVVRIDGVEVGRTPLDATVPVPAGEHDIVSERAGYLPEVRRVSVNDGAELTVHVRLERDPDAVESDVGTLELVLPRVRSAVRIDAEERSALGALDLPVGLHTLEIEAEDREAWAGEIEIPAGGTVSLAPPLVWTAFARRERMGRAESSRSAGLGLSIAGAAVLAVGMSIIVWNEIEISNTDARIAALAAEFTREGCPPRTTRCEEIAPEIEALTLRQGEQNIIRGVSVAGTLVGAILAATGIVLFATAPSDGDIDAEAHAALVVGPAGLSLRGAF